MGVRLSLPAPAYEPLFENGIAARTPIAQRTERLVADQKAGGSSPPGGTTRGVGVARSTRLIVDQKTTGSNPVRPAMQTTSGEVAPTVEREAEDLGVAGSSPALPTMKLRDDETVSCLTVNQVLHVRIVLPEPVRGVVQRENAGFMSRMPRVRLPPPLPER